MIESLDKLAERFDDQPTSHAIAGIRKSFMQTKRKSQNEKKKILLETTKIIRTAQQRIASWPIKDDDFSALRQGLQRAYKEGRTNMRRACEEPDTKHFHEWRKSVKNLFYQIRILKPIWPDVIGELAGELKKLAGYLSDDHDLALLNNRITDQANDTIDVREKDLLVSLIKQRREELQMMARPLGARIYLEKPAAFVDRLEAYWVAWGCEVKLKKMKIAP
jgi:CHAD domain-containing protein